MSYTKRNPVQKPPKDPLAASLEAIRRKIHAGKTGSALEELNQFAQDTSLTNQNQAKVLTLIGDAEKARRNPDAAATLYKQAKENLQQIQDQRDWFTPSLAEIRMLLRSGRKDKAFQKVVAAWGHAHNLVVDFNNTIEQLSTILSTKGEVQIEARPIRPSVILTKLGNLLEAEGYAADARYLYQQGVLNNPKGASRARQSLAKLAFQDGDDPTAEQYARESLLMGKFQAKSIASWPIYLKSRARQEKDPIDHDLVASLLLHGENQVKARSVWMICRTLRELKNDSWLPLAAKWIREEKETDPVITIEIFKLLLVDSKLTGQPPETVLRYAVQILLHPLSGPKEMIAAAKDIMRYNLLLRGASPDIEALVKRIERRHGTDFTFPLLHGIALAAMEAKRHDVGRQILNRILSQADPSSDFWGRAQMARGHMERVVNDYSASMAAWLSYVDNEAMPERFRLHALLQATSDAARVPDEETDSAKTERFRERILNWLQQVDDHSIWLDIARQAKMTGGLLESALPGLIAGATARAHQAFQQEPKIAGKMKILLHLTRRQYYDFRSDSEIRGQHLKITPKISERLWLEGGSKWWEYLSLVVRAHYRLGQTNDAESIIEQALSLPTTSPQGRVFLLHAKLLENAKQGATTKTRKTAQTMVALQPSHVNSALAHYWLGIHALQTGNRQQARKSMLAVRTCFANKPALYSHQELDVRAILALENLGHPTKDKPYEDAFISSQRRKLDQHIQEVKDRSG